MKIWSHFDIFLLRYWYFCIFIIIKKFHLWRHKMTSSQYFGTIFSEVIYYYTIQFLCEIKVIYYIICWKTLSKWQFLSHFLLPLSGFRPFLAGFLAGFKKFFFINIPRKISDHLLQTACLYHSSFSLKFVLADGQTNKQTSLFY